MKADKLEELLKQLLKLHPKYIDLSLKRLLVLLEKIDNPHLKMPPTIHIAGTNGKGSTLNYIYNILKRNNYLVHCYISPHIKNFEERFIVSNNYISRKKIFNTLKKIKKINQNNKITFFEITTAAAFYIFAKEKADFVILETGLGGRLDATNVIGDTLLDIITPISKDHQEFLGNNIYTITNEKLGIIKPSSKIIVSKQKEKINKHIINKLKLFKNEKIFYDKNYRIIKNQNKNFFLEFDKKIYKFQKPNLKGYHQVENASTAIASLIKIKELGYKITNKSINDGLSLAKWPGRLEQGYLKKIPVFLDGAHNIEGAKQLINYFKNNKINRWLIIGMLNNKDLINFIKKMKIVINGVIAIKIPKEKNSFETKNIAEVCKNLKIKCVEKKNISVANQYLLNVIKPEEIIISGSLYLIGKVRNLYI